MALLFHRYGRTKTKHRGKLIFSRSQLLVAHLENDRAAQDASSISPA